mgnify:CR=1 FL=1
MIVSHNNQKKIAVINDFSGFGRCSIAVSLPIISAMKIQCCPVPTFDFSNHTGLTAIFLKTIPIKCVRILQNGGNWICILMEICTGFLGSEAQIGIVGRFPSGVWRRGDDRIDRSGYGRLWKAVSDLYYGNVSGNEKTGALCRHSDTESDGGMHSDRHTL